EVRGARPGKAGRARPGVVGSEGWLQGPPAVRHPRDVERQPGALGLDRVALTAEQEAVERDVEREAPALPRGEPQSSKIEGGAHTSRVVHGAGHPARASDTQGLRPAALTRSLRSLWRWASGPRL